MIRFVLFALAIAVALWFAARAIQAARRSELDWTGIAFAIGFVVLAFYLRHVTGMG